MLKSAEIEEFEKAIVKVYEGGNYFSDEIVSLLSGKLNMLRKKKEKKDNLPEFTEREKEVLELICKGYANKQIAEATFLSIKTIEKHKKQFVSKNGNL